MKKIECKCCHAMINDERNWAQKILCALNLYVYRCDDCIGSDYK